MAEEFYRIKRLPPYVIAEVNAMRHAARREGRDIIEALQARFEHVYSFPTRAFFFGGVHAVLARGGEVIGAGDPRRGGAVVHT